jgi:hypothetical protein
MDDRSTPDDIKIIAQFLAERSGSPADWSDHKQQAFKLRQQLKLRGGYRLVRRTEPS